MSADRHRPVEPTTAAWELLREAGLDDDAGTDALAALFAAATAPGRPSELTGEDSAVAAFLAHHGEATAPPVPSDRRPPARLGQHPLRVTLAGAAAAVLLALLFAVGTGALSGSDHAHRAETSPRPPVTTTTTPTPTGPRVLQDPNPPTTPTAAETVQVLCRRYLDSPRSLTHAQVTQLLTAARTAAPGDGGRPGPTVRRYCGAVSGADER